MAESKSSKCSASDASAQRSPVEVSDFICHLGQRIVTEIKGAMLEAIRSMASGPVSASSPAENPVSQLQDLSLTCTNEICDKILALYYSQELHRSGEETTSVMSLKSLQDFQNLMKGLEKVVSVSRSSSWVSVSTTSDSVSTSTEVMTPGSASSTPQSESPFIKTFIKIALPAATEVLVEMEYKVASSTPSKTSVPASSETEPNSLMKLVERAATEIKLKLIHTLIFCSDAVESGPQYEEKFFSFAQKIHMDIHKQVFTFINERQQAVSEKSKTLLDACTETDAELDVSMENVWKSAAEQKSEQFLDKATQVASDILVKRLTSQISSGLISKSSSVFSSQLQSLLDWKRAS
ncbi:hypothetical protein KOW79_008178 [Hemibagrus wyckioides]|uniref:Uncharacterized protein n=1 Tax=Hemibagrus wyckioides TaxID=337641 RepID=A0A9D3SQP1_9TELE|nr:hypothetical protein KOW79_008178 [Hemibagrus wyckioides]